MPIRRRYDNEPDWMARKQDKQLIYLEGRISEVYEVAQYEVAEEFERFYSRYQDEITRRLALVEAGEMTQEEFAAWSRRRILQANQYRATLDMLTDVLVNADVIAMSMVREQLPIVLAESYNFTASLGFEAADRAGISIGTFEIYNADSVRVILRDNPILFPVVNLPEDEAWNRRHINNEITQAIIQGNTMEQVAQRLQNVTAMDNRSAIRNARTSMTAAENMGRSECASRLRNRGVPIDEVWLATKDSRTRATHLLLDGTRKDENGYFGADILRNPLRFPADPFGDAEEIYNCRCRLNIVLEGIDHSNDFQRYQSFMEENYPEDYEQLQEALERNGKADERHGALERQEYLREQLRSGKWRK